MSRTKQVIWTEQCKDGRACAGMFDNPAYVPDGIQVCDACLAAAYELDTVYDSCSCGHYSEAHGFSTESVLRALRNNMPFKRFYARMRVEWDSEKARLSIDSHKSYIGVYDSHDPWPRAAIEEWPHSHTASDRAYKLAKELNALQGEDVDLSKY